MSTPIVDADPALQQAIPDWGPEEVFETLCPALLAVGKCCDTVGALVHAVMGGNTNLKGPVTGRRDVIPATTPGGGKKQAEKLSTCDLVDLVVDLGVDRSLNNDLVVQGGVLKAFGERK